MRYNSRMGFKTGLVAGLAVGYYFGTRAGRERYEQISRLLRPVRESEAVAQLLDLGRGLVDDALTATKDALKDATAPDHRVIDFPRAG